MRQNMMKLSSSSSTMEPVARSASLPPSRSVSLADSEEEEEEEEEDTDGSSYGEREYREVMKRSTRNRRMSSRKKGITSNTGSPDSRRSSPRSARSRSGTRSSSRSRSVVPPSAASRSRSTAQNAADLRVDVTQPTEGSAFAEYSSEPSARVQQLRDKNGTTEPTDESSVNQRLAPDPEVEPNIPCTKDDYCWLCHRMSATLGCATCPRHFHLRCCGLEEALGGGARWICDDCIADVRNDQVENRSWAMRQITVPHLGKLLKLAVKEMELRVAESDMFTSPVSIPSYVRYVFNPMDLSRLASNIRDQAYGSPASFLADAKWIYHNSVIYNGLERDSAITHIAKKLVAVCKSEMAEIENCPECYLKAHTMSEWFKEVCAIPHLLVWAKVRRHPFWPAKVMKFHPGRDEVDCRFFGAHDRSLVPLKDVYLFSRAPPVTTNKKKNIPLEHAIEECSEYTEALAARYGRFELAPARIRYVPARFNEQFRIHVPSYRGKGETEEAVAEERQRAEQWFVPDSSADDGSACDGSAAGRDVGDLRSLSRKKPRQDWRSLKRRPAAARKPHARADAHHASAPDVRRADKKYLAVRKDLLPDAEVKDALRALVGVDTVDPLHRKKVTAEMKRLMITMDDTPLSRRVKLSKKYGPEASKRSRDSSGSDEWEYYHSVKKVRQKVPDWNQADEVTKETGDECPQPNVRRDNPFQNRIHERLQSVLRDPVVWPEGGDQKEGSWTLDKEESSLDGDVSNIKIESVRSLSTATFTPTVGKKESSMIARKKAMDAYDEACERPGVQVLRPNVREVLTDNGETVSGKCTLKPARTERSAVNGGVLDAPKFEAVYLKNTRHAPILPKVFTPKLMSLSGLNDDGDVQFIETKQTSPSRSSLLFKKKPVTRSPQNSLVRVSVGHQILSEVGRLSDIDKIKTLTTVTKVPQNIIEVRPVKSISGLNRETASGNTSSDLAERKGTVVNLPTELAGLKLFSPKQSVLLGLKQSPLPGKTNGDDKSSSDSNIDEDIMEERIPEHGYSRVSVDEPSCDDSYYSYASDDESQDDSASQNSKSAGKVDVTSRKEVGKKITGDSTGFLRKSADLDARSKTTEDCDEIMFNVTMVVDDSSEMGTKKTNAEADSRARLHETSKDKSLIVLGRRRERIDSATTKAIDGSERDGIVGKTNVVIKDAIPKNVQAFTEESLKETKLDLKSVGKSNLIESHRGDSTESPMKVVSESEFRKFCENRAVLDKVDELVTEGDSEYDSLCIDTDNEVDTRVDKSAKVDADEATVKMPAVVNVRSNVTDYVPTPRLGDTSFTVLPVRKSLDAWEANENTDGDMDPLAMCAVVEDAASDSDEQRKVEKAADANISKPSKNIPTEKAVKKKILLSSPRKPTVAHGEIVIKEEATSDDEADKNMKKTDGLDVTITRLVRPNVLTYRNKRKEAPQESAVKGTYLDPATGLMRRPSVAEDERAAGNEDTETQTQDVAAAQHRPLIRVRNFGPSVNLTGAVSMSVDRTDPSSPDQDGSSSPQAFRRKRKLDHDSPSLRPKARKSCSYSSDNNQIRVSELTPSPLTSDNRRNSLTAAETTLRSPSALYVVARPTTLPSATRSSPQTSSLLRTAISTLQPCRPIAPVTIPPLAPLRTYQGATSTSALPTTASSSSQTSSTQSAPPLTSSTPNLTAALSSAPPTTASSSSQTSFRQSAPPTGPNQPAGLMFATPVGGTPPPKVQTRMNAELAAFGQKMWTEFAETFIYDLAKNGSLEATVQAQRLDLERANWAHQNQLLELDHNFQLTMTERTNSFEAQLKAYQEKVVQLEAEKAQAVEAAVREAKKKQWCTNCLKEALFYCCWNTSYCGKECQLQHWNSHMETCKNTVRSPPKTKLNPQRYRPIATVPAARPIVANTQLRIPSRGNNSHSNIVLHKGVTMSVGRSATAATTSVAPTNTPRKALLQVAGATTSTHPLLRTVSLNTVPSDSCILTGLLDNGSVISFVKKNDKYIQVQKCGNKILKVLKDPNSSGEKRVTLLSNVSGENRLQLVANPPKKPHTNDNSSQDESSHNFGNSSPDCSDVNDVLFGPNVNVSRPKVTANVDSPIIVRYRHSNLEHLANLVDVIESVAKNSNEPANAEVGVDSARDMKESADDGKEASNDGKKEEVKECADGGGQEANRGEENKAEVEEKCADNQTLNEKTCTDNQTLKEKTCTDSETVDTIAIEDDENTTIISDSIAKTISKCEDTQDLKEETSINSAANESVTIQAQGVKDCAEVVNVSAASVVNVEKEDVNSETGDPKDENRDRLTSKESELSCKDGISDGFKESETSETVQESSVSNVPAVMDSADTGLKECENKDSIAVDTNGLQTTE